MLIRIILTLLIIAFAGTGCKLIYKQNIQQGNAIEQDDLDELYIGMNQRQVLFVLGTPSVKDPFHQERWDYVQTFSRRGGAMVERTVTLRFEDDLLTEIIGGNDPFAATSGGAGSESSEVASFVKKPKPDAKGPAAKVQSPQDAAVDSVQEEVLKGVDPDIDTINERNAEDRDYQKDQGVLDQTPDHDLTTPDIDG
jgi:outer membrane protein assembly factor BamE